MHRTTHPKYLEIFSQKLNYVKKTKKKKTYLLSYYSDFPELTQFDDRIRYLQNHQYIQIRHSVQHPLTLELHCY